MEHDLMSGPVSFENRATTTSSSKNMVDDNSHRGLRRPLVEEDDDSSDDDEKPLASRKKKLHGERNQKLKRIKQAAQLDDDSSLDDDRQTLAARFPNLSCNPPSGRRGGNADSDSEEDRLPLADRLSRLSSSESIPNSFLDSAAPLNKKAKVPSDECTKSKPPATAKNVLRTKISPSSSNKNKEKAIIETTKGTVEKSQLSKTVEAHRRGPTSGNRKSKPPAKNIVNIKRQGSGAGKKWSTLEHNGVVFPPPYKPHGVKMLYNGQPVDLTPEQEEVATMFAVIKDTEDASNETFISNFFTDWRKILGETHTISKFEFCDFTPIYEWHLGEKDKKKQMAPKVLPLPFRCISPARISRLSI
jgi:DNA topoisomerase-1